MCSHLVTPPVSFLSFHCSLIYLLLWRRVPCRAPARRPLLGLLDPFFHTRGLSTLLARSWRAPRHCWRAVGAHLDTIGAQLARTLTLLARSWCAPCHHWHTGQHCWCAVSMHLNTIGTHLYAVGVHCLPTLHAVYLVHTVLDTIGMHCLLTLYALLPCAHYLPTLPILCSLFACLSSLFI